MKALAFAILLFIPFYLSVPAHAQEDYNKLIKLAVAGDAQSKAQAQYALIKIGGPAVPALLEALDKREGIPELVFILNGIKDSRAAAHLVRLLDLKDEDALECVEKAAFALGKDSIPYLFEALKDKSRSERAAEVLSALKEKEYFENLRRCLKDKEDYIRRGSSRVELSWLDPAAKEEMEALLKDKDVEVRRNASAYFLASAPNFPLKDIIVLLDDPDAQVRKNLVQTASRLRDDRCFEKLSAILLKDADPEARKLAAEALFRCNGDKAVKPLTAALKDSDLLVASASARRLGDLKAAEAAVPLQELLKDKGKISDEVVDAVAGALADIGVKFDANIILPYVNWDNLYVVRSVIRAWETSAVPDDTKIKDALRNYLNMPVDDRYKDRVKTLLDRLG